MNEDMSNETMAMLLASYDQILEEIRSDKDEVNDALKNSISRTLNQMNSQSLEKVFAISILDIIICGIY